MPTTALPDAAELRQLLTYDPDTGKLFWKPRPREMFKTHRSFSAWNARFAGKEAFTAKTQGYPRGRLHDIGYLAHRVIWAIVTGRDPGELHIDHINGDRSDNRLSNLRSVTVSDNQRNAARSKNNRSGHLGVHWYARDEKWHAQIYADGKKYHLGYFDHLEDAIAARKAAEIEHGYHPNHGR